MTAPSTTYSSALWFGMMPKSGYGAGRHWVFMASGSYIKFSSTSDATGDPAQHGSQTSTGISASNGQTFGVLIRGSRVYLFYCAVDSSPCYMKAGTLASDGTITWDSQQTVVSGTQMRITSLDFDSTGALLIGYYDTNKGKVHKGTVAADGTWTSASGYPKQVTDADSIQTYVKVLALTAGKWIALHVTASGAGGYVYAKVWDGSALSSLEQCSDVIASDTPRWDARAYGDKVYLAWNGQPATFNIYRRVRSAAGTWGTSVIIETGCQYYHVPAVCVNKTTGDVMISWQGFPTDLHVYYQLYTAKTDTWGSVVDAATESSLANTYQHVGMPEAAGNIMAFYYLTGSSTYYLDRIYIASATPGGLGLCNILNFNSVAVM